MHTLFTAEDHARIEASVAKAEQRTSGEIVPYLVAASDSYPITRWRSAALFLIIAMVVTFAARSFYSGWATGWLYTSWGLTLVAILAAGIGLLLVELMPAYKRWLAGTGPMSRMVKSAARQAFLEEELFKTRDRTGILIFISVFEHRIEVLGDEGINEAVDPGEWEDVVDAIRSGIIDNDLADAIVRGIEKCGNLLQIHGVEIEPDDTDELPNKMRIRKRL